MAVAKIQGIPSVCERNMIVARQSVGDSVLLEVPFNVRGVQRKQGIVMEQNKVRMDLLVCEGGDSGGLVITRDGIIGMEFRTLEEGTIIRFVPMSVFENLYYGVVQGKK